MTWSGGPMGAAVERAGDGRGNQRYTRPELAWHSQPVESVFEAFGTTSFGLSAAEATRRLTAVGFNELQEVARTSAWHTLAAQFRNVLILILLVATLLPGVLGHAIEAIVIAAIVLFAVLLGFVQEYRAERALEALRRMAAPLAHVIRDGAERSIEARDVVPGDVVVLRAGDRVPADCRVSVAVNLAVDEAALTGESAAVTKRCDEISTPKLAVADRRNMAYAGTVVTYGRGQGIVVATGMSTEFGRISGLVQSVQAEGRRCRTTWTSSDAPWERRRSWSWRLSSRSDCGAACRCSTCSSSASHWPSPWCPKHCLPS